MSCAVSTLAPLAMRCESAICTCWKSVSTKFLPSPTSLMTARRSLMPREAKARGSEMSVAVEQKLPAPSDCNDASVTSGHASRTTSSAATVVFSVWNQFWPESSHATRTLSTQKSLAAASQRKAVRP